MEVLFADVRLERTCTDEKTMKKRFPTPVVKGLKLRLSELRAVPAITDLLQRPGRWEQLREDRAGQWSGRLTANLRLLVEPRDDGTVVMVVAIEDYH